MDCLETKNYVKMYDSLIEKQTLDNLLAVSEIKPNLGAWIKVKDDYSGFLDEIIDDLETFYDVSKYPAVEIAVSLLKDYRNTLYDHYPSKTTLHFLKTWRSKK